MGRNLHEIITDVHNQVNAHRRNIGLKPWKFEDRSDYIERVGYTMSTDLINETKDDGAPFCICDNCTSNPSEAVRTERAGRGFTKYARGHKPQTEVAFTRRGLGSITDFASVLVTKVYSKQEYKARQESNIDERIVSLLRQVNNGAVDEVTVIYPTKEFKRTVIKQLQKGIQLLSFKIELTNKKDHIALTKVV